MACRDQNREAAGRVVVCRARPVGAGLDHLRVLRYLADERGRVRGRPCHGLRRPARGHAARHRQAIPNGDCGAAPCQSRRRCLASRRGDSHPDSIAVHPFRRAPDRSGDQSPRDADLPLPERWLRGAHVADQHRPSGLGDAAREDGRGSQEGASDLVSTDFGARRLRSARRDSAARGRGPVRTTGSGPMRCTWDCRARSQLREGLAGRGVVCHLRAMVHAAFSSIGDSYAMDESPARWRPTARNRGSQAVAPPSTASVVAVM